jgi:hypothetical protein
MPLIDRDRISRSAFQASAEPRGASSESNEPLGSLRSPATGGRQAETGVSRPPPHSGHEKGRTVDRTETDETAGTGWRLAVAFSCGTQRP